MSGCFTRVLLGNEIGDAFGGKSREPKRHCVIADTSPAGNGKFEDASLNIELWQIADVRDPVLPALSPHDVHSPRSNIERFPLGTYGRDSDKRINRFTKFLFDQRLSAFADMFANDNWHPLEAA
jgi:hypothetical protein